VCCRLWIFDYEQRAMRALTSQTEKSCQSIFFIILYCKIIISVGNMKLKISLLVSFFVILTVSNLFANDNKLLSMVTEYLKEPVIDLSSRYDIYDIDKKEYNKYRNMTFLGGNYSQLITTKGENKISFNFGYYRISHLWKQLHINYGFMYSKKKMALNNKKIRSSYVFEYYENCDINIIFNILELNIIGGYNFKIGDNISICPLIGAGHSIFFKPESEIQRGQGISQNEPVEEYDYEFAFTDGPPIVNNSGTINHFGFIASYRQYFGMLTYTNYLKTLSSAGALDLILNERISSINVLMGVYF